MFSHLCYLSLSLFQYFDSENLSMKPYLLQTTCINGYYYTLHQGFNTDTDWY